MTYRDELRPNCEGLQDDRWFPDNRGYERARELDAEFCSTCPLARACARLALSDSRTMGVFAGEYLPQNDGGGKYAARARLRERYDIPENAHADAQNARIVAAIRRWEATNPLTRATLAEFARSLGVGPEVIHRTRRALARKRAMEVA